MSSGHHLDTQTIWNPRAKAILPWVILFLFALQALAQAQNERFQAPDGEILGTGARRPDEAQLSWAEENMVKTKGVRFNALGLARINHHRAQGGHKPLPADEVVTLGTEATPTTNDVGTTTTTAASSLPTYVDNSTLPSFPPIRSQGSLGSCAQFSAVYYTLTHMTALARNWNAKTGGDSYRFSPKWTYNMLNGGSDSRSLAHDPGSLAPLNWVS